MIRTLIQAGFGSGKTQRLSLAARDALRAGAGAGDILALAPRSPSAAVLRDRLHGITGQDIPTTTARSYALRLLATDPASVGLPSGWSEADVLSGIDRRLLLRVAWSQAGSAGGSLWELRGEQPGALDWIGRLFDRWSAWAGTADPEQLPEPAVAHAGLRELWRAYRLYLRLCRQLGVVGFAEVWNRAADLLRLSGRPEPRLLLLDDLELFQPDELQLVALSAGASGDIIGACAGAPTLDSPLAAQRWLARWARRLHLRPQTLDNAGRTPALLGGEYTSPDDEAAAIAGQIAARGGDPSDYAVIPFDAELVPLLRRALASYGLPLAGGEARDAHTLAIAPWARAGLALLAGDEPAAADLLRLLHDPALGLDPADARIAIEAARAGALRIGAGARLPSALSADGRARLRRPAAAARAAGEGLPSQRLRRWLARLGVAASCDARTEAALGADAADVDRRLWQRWLGFLERSETLRAALGMPLQGADAAAILESAQALVEPEEPRREPAVALWQPGELGGRVAANVYVAGLHEGALPRPLPALPFAEQLDDGWQALPNYVALEPDDRRAAWARGEEELQRAIGRAYGSAYLSYSRADRDQRRRLASPLLAAALGTELDRHGRLALGTSSAVKIRPPAMPRIAAPALSDHVEHESPYITSPSALEDYFTCPRRSFYARRLGLYDVRSSPRQALGMVVHDALDELLAGGPQAGLDPQYIAELVDRHWGNDERRWGSALRRDVFRQLAERAVANVARYESEHGAGRFFASELPFDWSIDDVVIRGRLDRVDRDADGLHVVDYKLGRESPSLAALLAEFVPPADAPGWRPGDIQLPVYALALEAGATPELAGERVVDVTLVYPLELYNDKGKPSVKGRRELRIIDHADGCPACQQPPARWTTHGLVCRRQLEQLRERLLQAVAAMRQGEWPADPRDGAQTCAFCAFRPICPGAR